MPKGLVPLAAAALLAGLAVAVPGAIRGQTPDPAVGGLRELALRWAEGDFRAPLICHIEGEPRRGLRRLQITRGSRDGHRPQGRIVFPGLQTPPGTRCHDELGREEPNVIGSLIITFEGRSRPDTARFDLSEALRRQGGFTYPIVAGVLRVGPTDAESEGLERVDFKGGTAELKVVERGTDSFRRLADFGSRRKLSLVLTAPDGTSLAFDLAQIDGS